MCDFDSFPSQGWNPGLSRKPGKKDLLTVPEIITVRVRIPLYMFYYGPLAASSAPDVELCP